MGDSSFGLLGRSKDKNKSVNQQVLGLYVHEWKADKVLQKDNKFLICKKIEEAQIVG